MALVSMRPIAVNKQQTYVPPSYTGAGGPYGGWGPYYGYGWGAAYSPGYVVTDTVVRVETLVFDLKQNKLVWAGQSETTNPDSLHQFMRDLVKAIGADMRRKGVDRRAGLLAGCKAPARPGLLLRLHLPAVLLEQLRRYPGRDSSPRSRRSRPRGRPRGGRRLESRHA